MLPVEMRTSTSGCAATKEVRRGISQSAGEARRRADHDRLGLAPPAVSARLARSIAVSASVVACVEGPALLGERQGAVQAPEQRHAEPLFEGLDLPADRRLGQRDLVAGAGEAEVAGRRLEGDQQLERRQLEEATAACVAFGMRCSACDDMTE